MSVLFLFCFWFGCCVWVRFRPVFGLMCSEFDIVRVGRIGGEIIPGAIGSISDKGGESPRFSGCAV